jgi:hypothetical protein
LAWQQIDDSEKEEGVKRKVSQTERMSSIIPFKDEH